MSVSCPRTGPVSSGSLGSHCCWLGLCGWFEFRDARRRVHHLGAALGRTGVLQGQLQAHHLGREIGERRGALPRDAGDHRALHGLGHRGVARRHHLHRHHIEEIVAGPRLNTLTINKVGSDDGRERLCIADHRVPSGFAPAAPRSSAQRRGVSDDGWRIRRVLRGPGLAGRARLPCVLARGIPHGFTVSHAGPGRAIIVLSPGGFDQFVAALGEPTQELRLPEPVPPDPARVTQLAAAHGIQILPPAQP